MGHSNSLKGKMDMGPSISTPISTSVLVEDGTIKFATALTN